MKRFTPRSTCMDCQWYGLHPMCGPGDNCMTEDEQGRYVRIEDAGCPPAEQIAEAVTVARLPLLQAIKDLEAQVKVLREDSERKSSALRRLEKFSAYTARRHA